MTNQPVPLPHWRSHLPREEAKIKLAEDIRVWSTSDALDGLVAAWGAKLPLGQDLGSGLSWLDDFSAEHWDFRGGRERNLVEPPPLTTLQEETTLQAATSLGLINSRRPRHDEYDAVLVLGGLVRACFVRPRYAAELISSGVRCRRVVGLGGFRPLAGDELGLARYFGADVADEMHAMVEGMRQAFDIVDSPVYENGGQAGGNADWEVARFPEVAPSGIENVSVLAAPSSEPAQRRANSVDTYLWWAERCGLHSGARVLMITTTIYVPYQGAGAIQALSLRYGADVETVGVPARLADLGHHTQQFLPHHYLQELRSAVRGYRSLFTAISTN